MSKEREIALLEEALETIKLPKGDPNRGFGIIGRIQAYLKEEKGEQRSSTHVALARQYLNMICPQDFLRAKMISECVTGDITREQARLLTECIDIVIPKYMEILVPLYMDEFTEEDLQNLIKFRKTPTGVKELQSRERIIIEGSNTVNELMRQEMKNCGLI